MAKRSPKKSDVPTAIDVKEAIRRAGAFLGDVFADEQIQNLRLEEVEFLDDEKCWLVTLSFLRPIAAVERPPWEVAMSGNKYRREYKAVHVDARSGEARSIKMRWSPSYGE